MRSAAHPDIQHFNAVVSGAFEEEMSLGIEAVSFVEGVAAYFSK